MGNTQKTLRSNEINSVSPFTQISQSQLQSRKRLSIATTAITTATTIAIPQSKSKLNVNRHRQIFSPRTTGHICDKAQFVKQNFPLNKLILLLNVRLNLLGYRGDIQEVLSEMEYEILIQMFLDQNPTLELYYLDTQNLKYANLSTRDKLIQFIAKIYDIE